MSLPVDLPLPQDCQLDAGYTITFEAIDPTTGAAISGVTVTDALIFGTPLGGSSGAELASGPFMLVPGPGA